MAPSTDIYLTLQRVLIDQQRFSEALTMAEQARWRARWEDRYGELPPPWVMPNLEDLHRQLIAEDLTLVYYSLLYDQTQLQRFKTFPPDRYAYATDLVIWVWSPGGELRMRSLKLEGMTQDRPGSLGALVRRWCDLTEQGTASAAQQRDLLGHLYDLLIAPIVDWLPPQGTLAISPQDFLYRVPFGILCDPQGHCLIETYPLRYLPGLDCLNRSPQPPNPSAEQGLWVQEVRMPQLSHPEGWCDLPRFTGYRDFVPTPAITLKGPYATKAHVRKALTRQTWAHLSTYAVFDPQGGIAAALALSPTFGDNGFLLAQEIRALSLTQLHLVTVEGCYPPRCSGWGNGLEQWITAWLGAGVGYVLQSLWSVEEAVRGPLMTDFYQAYGQGLPPALALQRAMIRQGDRCDRPDRWGAFSLFG